MFNYTKGLAPVVATALILVVAVLSVVNFESFYSSFESSVLADLNDNSNSISSLQVQGVFDNYLYLNSDLSSDVEILKILSKNGSVMCDYENNNLNKNISSFEILKMSFDSSTYNGTHIKDLSSYHNDGFINGSISFSNNCVMGNCFEYSDNGFISILENDSLKPNEVTISAWFMFNDMINNGNENIISMGWKNHRIFTTSNISNGLVYYEDNGSLTQFHIQPNFEVNKYYFVSTIYGNNRIKFFLNDEIYLDNFTVTNINYSFADRNLKIGTSDLEYFNGFIDELKIYSKALTQDEIKNLYYFNSPSLNITKGINQIGVPGCRLESGKSYDILIKTSNSNLLESTINVK